MFQRLPFSKVGTFPFLSVPEYAVHFHFVLEREQLNWTDICSIPVEDGLEFKHPLHIRKRALFVAKDYQGQHLSGSGKQQRLGHRDCPLQT
jgi:hypothetical protein